MDYINDRFSLINETHRKYITFNLNAGDGTLKDGLLEVFPDGNFHLHAKVSSSDRNDKFELKFTFVAKEGYTIEVTPHSRSTSDPHYFLNIEHNYTDYIYDIRTPDSSGIYEKIDPGTYGGSIYVDISYRC